MRIGIDLRVLSSGRSAATRGMPRYTQQQLREVLHRDRENEYALFLEPTTEPSLVLPEILTADNVTVQLVPERLAGPSPGPRELPAKSELFQAWIASQDLDLYHATTPFYLEQLVLSRIEPCPVVATLYDLIPMIFPAHYLLDERIADDYVRAATQVAGATRVLAISENARREANLYLGVPLHTVDVAWPIAEPFFRPMTRDVTNSVLSRLECEVGLPETIILAVPHLHFTKNIEGLLRAYALVPSAVRCRAPLVVACHLDAHGEARIRRVARHLRISDDLIVTGLVRDDELAALYNRALFLVHPSRYEGFGLPVLEAMQCGTAVITSTSSALPELAGDAALLVDPEDAPDLADAMMSLLDDSALRDLLGARGLARAAHFSPDQLAEATLSSYRKAVSGDGAERRRDGKSRDRRVVLTKASEVEDFEDQAISTALSDLGVECAPGRRAWAHAMAVHALRTSGAVVPGARVLLTEKSSVALVSCFGDANAMVSPLGGPDRIGAVRRLPFDDETFHAVVSCGSIQRLGGFDAVAGAAYEMGRILEPGGILSISTDIIVAGPPGGVGSPGGLLFTSDLIERYIVDASGLEPVGSVDFELSSATVESERDMEAVRAGRSGAVRPPPADSAEATLIQVRNGCAVAAVHLTLRRSERYPATANEWARPSAVPDSAQEENRDTPGLPEPDVARGTAPGPMIPDYRRRVQLVSTDLLAWQAGIDAALRDVAAMLPGVIRDLERLDDLLAQAASPDPGHAVAP